MVAILQNNPFFLWLLYFPTEVWSLSWKSKFYFKVKTGSHGAVTFKFKWISWAMMSALAMSGALVWSGLSCQQASRPGQPLIFRVTRRPVVSGSLGCLACSLIDGLSVWSNYPGPDWEAGDSVDRHVHIKLHKHNNSVYKFKLLASTAD